MIINIRHAAKADISLLVQISKKTFHDAFHDNNSSQESFEKYLAEAFTINKIRSEFEQPISLFLLAENEDGKTVAYTKLRWDNRRDELMPSTNYIEVERIYVLKDYWRMGVGRFMMNEITDLARKRQYEYVCLSVYEENSSAIRFYEQLDFQAIGKVIFELGDVIEYDILMIKNVTQTFLSGI